MSDEALITVTYACHTCVATTSRDYNNDDVILSAIECTRRNCNGYMYPTDTETPKQRATYLLESDLRMLEDWANRCRLAMREPCLYLVGSALVRPDYRDVDVRCIMDDDKYKAISKDVSMQTLSFTYSLWGQKATGLKIDFQVQAQTKANAQFNGRRHAIGHILDVVEE